MDTDRRTFKRQDFSGRAWRWRNLAVVLFVGLLLLTGARSFGQTVATYNTADGTTPAALAPGAPAGSYTLSDFENINLYNGQLSIALPLLNVGGRKETGYTINLAVSRPPWTVDVDAWEDEEGYRFSTYVHSGLVEPLRAALWSGIPGGKALAVERLGLVRNATGRRWPETCLHQDVHPLCVH